MPAPRSLKVFLAGANFPARQKVIRKLRSPCTADLVREPDNPADADAVAVFVGGRQIGYIPAHTAPDVADVIDSLGKWTYGVTQLVVRPPSEEFDFYGAELWIEPVRRTGRVIGSLKRIGCMVVVFLLATIACAGLAPLLLRK